MKKFQSEDLKFLGKTEREEYEGTKIEMRTQENR